MNITQGMDLHINALMLSAKRADVLANNLVNADTPGYKAQDFNFKAALNDAVNNAQMFSVPGDNDVDLVNRAVAQPSSDGNTVDTQIEKVAFMDNAMRYQASLSFLNSHIRGLLTAIRGE